MKKTIGLMALLLCLTLVGCSETKAGNNDKDNSTNNGSAVLEITEKMFIQQCDDIHYNPDDYKEKTIIIEGLCSVWQDENDKNKTNYAVYRNTPGCCGNDGQSGFQIEYDGKKPRNDDWIRVEGTPKVTETEDGYKLVTLMVTKLTVKDDKGAEFVTY